VNSIDDFLGLIRDGLGLSVTTDDAGRALNEISGWDSVHLLWLLTAMEQETGHTVSMPELLEASSLEELYLASVGT
jgi:hypothetical protein